MPRQARRKSSSDIYHIMLRGNERKEVFLDQSDKKRFLFTLQKMKKDDKYELYAYCLMNNHVHLLMKEKKEKIEKSMKRICVSYVYYFNKKYDRIGHLFQDRYRSEPVEDESYCLEVSRYIHNNPVKANITSNPGDYSWSSYNIYIKPSDDGEEVLVDREFLLSLMAGEEAKAIEIFKEFTNQQTHDDFLEYNDEPVFNPIDLEKEIIRILGQYKQDLKSIKNCNDKKLRKKLIKEIKNKTNGSIREIARILEISKDTVYRA